MTLDIGIHDGIAPEIYHGDCTTKPALSASLASTLVWKGKRKAWAKSTLNPKLERATSTTFDIGTAAHLLLLESGEFDRRTVLIEADNYLTKAAKLERDDAYADGKTPLLVKHLEQIVDMRLALRNALEDVPFPTAQSFAEGGFQGGTAERVYVWRDKVTGVLCKCRLDYVKPRDLVDYKTSAIGLDDIDAYASRMHWHERAAWYLDGHFALTGTRATYWYIIQATTYPYIAEVHKVSAEDIERGRALNAEGCRLWAECLAGDWSDGPERAGVVHIAQWQRYRDMDRLGEERDDARRGFTPAPKPADHLLKTAYEMQRP